MDIRIGAMGGGIRLDAGTPQLKCKVCDVEFGDTEASASWDKLGKHLVEHKKKGDNVIADIDGIYLAKLYYWSYLAGEEYHKVILERNELREQLEDCR